MAVDPNIHPGWAQDTKEIADGLDALDYFQVLGSTPDSPIEALKERYHQLLRNYHPDAFFTSPDLELRAAVTKISKRVTEAYVTLKDSERREAYTRNISGPERELHLRFSEESERELRKEREEQTGRTPQGRKLWQKALEALRRGDTTSAQRDIQTALIFEPDNALFKAKLEATRTGGGKR